MNVKKDDLLQGSVTLLVHECGTCGTLFALPESLYDACRREGGFFHCPLGHQRGWHEGERERERKDLKKQLERERQRHEATQGRVGALMDKNAKISRQYMRIRERVSNGVCPCCNRTFQNLMAHMKKQHPEFSDTRKAVRFLRDVFGLTQDALGGEIGVSAAQISNYERGNHVGQRTEESIQQWLTANAKGETS